MEHDLVPLWVSRFLIENNKNDIIYKIFFFSQWRIMSAHSFVFLSTMYYCGLQGSLYEKKSNAYYALHPMQIKTVAANKKKTLLQIKKNAANISFFILWTQAVCSALALVSNSDKFNPPLSFGAISVSSFIFGFLLFQTNSVINLLVITI